MLGKVFSVILLVSFSGEILADANTHISDSVFDSSVFNSLVFNSSSFDSTDSQNVAMSGYAGILKSTNLFDDSAKPSIVSEYKKLEYEHQLIYLDPRSKNAENREEIANKVREFGENLDDKGLVLMLNSGVTESRLALVKVLKEWGLDPANYSPSDGPFLIGHVEISQTGKDVEGRTHITDFSGMNTACIKDYIDNIEWSIFIKDVGSGVARQRWTERSLICEGSKIVKEGYSNSINEAYQYFKSWFR